MARITMVIDDDKQLGAYEKARTVFLDYLAADKNLTEALGRAFSALSEALGFNLLGLTDIDHPDGSLILTLPDKEFGKWIHLSETCWRKHICETSINFAEAIDDGIEQQLESLGLAVYSEYDSPARDRDVEASEPAPSKPARGRLTRQTRAKQAARAGRETAKAAAGSSNGYREPVVPLAAATH